MWQINSQSINVFAHCGIKVLDDLNLPYDAHTWLSGSLLKRFIVMTLPFLFCMLKSHNGIVQVCTLNALSNANSPMVSNFFFLRFKYGINF